MTTAQFPDQPFVSPATRDTRTIPVFPTNLHVPYRNHDQGAIAQPADSDPRYGPTLQPEYIDWVYECGIGLM